ncbi:ABC transporter ATP-binding protein [Candidatus Woesearchaeota archaeon]|nr:MAG: ABC transporter ATP-binding protein [Candidatus Woesearchaeota archaeon]
MEGTIDITNIAFLASFLLLLIPLLISHFLKLKIIKEFSISIFRMTAQLFLVGIFLVFLFDYNNLLLNIAWFLVMVIFAGFSVINAANLKLKKFFFPITLSLGITAFLMMAYFNYVIIGISNIFDARYMIAIVGMILGNILRSNIITLNNFYDSIIKEKEIMQFKFTMGATLYESLKQNIDRSIKSALKPVIANMATIGIVFLPGMLTGQILSGASPYTAIKYQIAIMIAIFVASSISLALTLSFSIKQSFDKQMGLKGDILNNKFYN